MTTNTHRAWTSDVRLVDSGLPTDSVAQCNLCSVVDRLQVVAETGVNVGSVLLAQIRSVIGDLVDVS